MFRVFCFGASGCSGSFSSGFASHPEPNRDTFEYLLVASSVAFPIALFGHRGRRSFGLSPGDSAVDDLKICRASGRLPTRSGVAYI